MNKRTAVIEVPASLPELLSAGLGNSAVPRWIVEAIVLRGVSEGYLSVGEAGELLGLGYFQAEALLKEKGIPATVSDSEFDQDQADLKEITAQVKNT